MACCTDCYYEEVKHLPSTYQFYHNPVWFSAGQCSTIGKFESCLELHQGCVLSPTLFKIFLEIIMMEVLENFERTVTIGAKKINNLRFADYIDGLTGIEAELKQLVNQIDKALRKYGMVINTDKTKVMTNNLDGFRGKLRIEEEPLEVVTKFKYLRSIISDKGSKTKIVARIGQASSALNKLNCKWKLPAISTCHKLKLINSLVVSVFNYTCESWTLTADLEKRIKSFQNEML